MVHRDDTDDTGVNSMINRGNTNDMCINRMIDRDDADDVGIDRMGYGFRGLQYSVDVVINNGFRQQDCIYGVVD